MRDCRSFLDKYMWTFDIKDSGRDAPVGLLPSTGPRKRQSVNWKLIVQTNREYCTPVRILAHMLLRAAPSMALNLQMFHFLLCENTQNTQSHNLSTATPHKCTLAILCSEYSLALCDNRIADLSMRYTHRETRHHVKCTSNRQQTAAPTTSHQTAKKSLTENPRSTYSEPF